MRYDGPSSMIRTVVWILALMHHRAIAADSSAVADAAVPANVGQPADARQPSNSMRSIEERIPATPEAKKNGDVQKADLQKDSKPAEAKSTKPIIREGEGFDMIAAPLGGTIAPEPLLNANRALRTARIHEKFGAAEHGNVREFSLAIQSIDTAATHFAAVNSPPPSSSIAHDLEFQLRGMRESAATTFFGRFPLVRAFGLWPENDEEFEVRSYSRKGEARRHAVYSALNQIAKAASADPLHALILVPGVTVDQRTSSPLAKTVDSQSREAFANVANITVYPGALRAIVDPMPSWTSPDSAFDPICREFLKQISPEKDPRTVMLVLVREFVDEYGDDYWVQAQQRTYEATTLEKAEGKPESLEADKVKVFESLAHDRSRFSLGLWSGIAALYVLALVIHRFLSWIWVSTGGWQRWFAIPTAGFLIGVGLTPFIMLAMKRWMPDPQSNAATVAWWPSLAGALSVVLPAGVFRLGAGAAGRYAAGLSCHGRWGIAFVPVALGVSAAWIHPTCYAIGLHCWYVVLMLAIAASFIVYCFGRAVDVADEFPVALTPITVGLSLMFGAGAFMASPTFLAAVIGMSILTTAIHILIIWRTSTAASESDRSITARHCGSETPRTIEQLRAALRAPRYHATRTFRQFQASITSSADRQTRWIGLVGPAAVGKTAAAHILIEEIQSRHPELNLLAGRCTENSPPFQPFKEALAKLGASAGIIATNSQMGEVNTIFERLADEFIPFWDFFSVDTDEDSKESSRHDLLDGVLNVFHKLTQRQPVLFFLDDVQWIDEGSAQLLRHLHENFHPGDAEPLTIVVASRESKAIVDLGLDVTMFSLEPPSAEEQVQFLVVHFGIERQSAIHLVKALGVMNQQAGNIFWLIRSLGELVDQDALEPGENGFSLRLTYLHHQQLPVPDVIRAKLGASLRASGQYLPVLECAALMGETFRVDDLAQCLCMDRLLLLQILRHLEQELQLVRDIATDEDRYAFSSEFMLEIVREELGVGGASSKASRPGSKIARELHARIAGVLERREPRTPQLVCDIARHFHAAGKAYAAKCLDYSIAAAETARKQFAFQTARAYLDLAEEGARATHQLDKLLTIRLMIDREDASAVRLAPDKPNASLQANGDRSRPIHATVVSTARGSSPEATIGT